MRNTVLEAAEIHERVQEVIDMRNHDEHEGKVFVLVEGEDDQLFYGRFLDDHKVSYYVTENCMFVVEMLKILNANVLFNNRLFGIKDADFDYVLGRNYSDIENLFLTDMHDWEMTFVDDDFETTLFAEYKISSSIPLVAKVCEDLRSLSYLRLYNDKAVMEHNLDGLNFKAGKLSNIYDGENSIDIESCVNYYRTVANNSSLRHYPTAEQIQEIAEEFISEDIKQITRGHDMIAALNIRLTRVAGNDPNGLKGLPKLLRASCRHESFIQTDLGRNINDWMELRDINLWRVA